MSATDTIDSPSVEETLGEILLETDLTTIEEGKKVLCFQPGPSDDRQSTEILVRSTLRSELKRTAGWYMGVVKEHQGDWLVVEEIHPQGLDIEDGEETSLWDVNGKEFPVYLVDQLPQAIDEIVHGVTHLREFFESASRVSLEDEFFSR